MQPPTPRNALLARVARLVADHQPITLLELAIEADVSHDVMRSALNALERLGVVKNHGRTYEIRHTSAQHTERPSEP